MTKKTFDTIANLISNIIDTTYNAYHINLGLTLNDEKQIMSDIKKIHRLSPTLDDNNLKTIKTCLPHSKEYAGGSLGDLVLEARLVNGQLFLKHPKYNPNI